MSDRFAIICPGYLVQTLKGEIEDLWGGNLTVIKPMSDDAGKALEGAFRCGGPKAVEALREGSDDEIRDVLSLLFVAGPMES